MAPSLRRPTERSEPLEIQELRRLRALHPELSSAVDLQLALLAVLRRVTSRIPLPVALLAGPAPDSSRSGHPLLKLEDLPLSWADFRSVFREMTDVLARFDEIAPSERDALVAIARDGEHLVRLADAWFRNHVERATTPEESLPNDLRSALDQVVTLSFRPFLVRCAEALAPRLPAGGATSGVCPACGGEPELAVLADEPDRVLVCHLCSLRWAFPMPGCTFCGNDDPVRLTQLASRDRVYRVLACESCRRYLKAYDTRFGSRPALPAVDAIATLPLDAAAMQRGYIA